MKDLPMRKTTNLKRRAATMLTAVATAAMVAIQPAAACTSFLLPTSDGESVYGRTMEFGFQLDSQMMVVPRGYSFASVVPDGSRYIPSSRSASTAVCVG